MGNFLFKLPSNEEIFNISTKNKKGPYQNLGNPGTVEDIHKDCRSILPQTFRGVRFVFNKCLSNNFMASHILNILPNTKYGTYKFGVSYVGDNKRANEGNFPLLFGEMQRNGSMDSNIIHYINDHIRLKFGAEYLGKNLDTYQMSIDYFGNTFSGSLGLANLDCFQYSGIILGQYLQSVTEYLSLGSEIGLHMKLDGFSDRTILNFISKYKTEDVTLSASIGGNGVYISCAKIASPSLKYAFEFISDLQSRNNSIITLGYEALIPETDFIFRGSFDTKSNIYAVLQKKLQDLPYAIFTISAKLNQKSGKFKLGCGIVIS